MKIILGAVITFLDVAWVLQFEQLVKRYSLGTVITIQLLSYGLILPFLGSSFWASAKLCVQPEQRLAFLIFAVLNAALVGMWYYVTRTYDVLYSANFAALTPAALIVTYLWYGAERLSLSQVIGFGLISIGIWLVK